MTRTTSDAGSAPTRPVLVLPRALQAGDRVAAWTGSWGGPAAIPGRFDAGVRQLEEQLGVTVVDLPHTRTSDEELWAHPEWRAADLHAALLDPDIAGIVSSIGGDDSIRVLPHLDLDVIRANPKPFVGYSDTTCTHMAFLRAGVCSFYGPSIMSGFGENGGLHDYLVAGFRATVMGGPHSDGIPGGWPPNVDGWTVERLEWDDPELQGRRRTLQPCDGWRWHVGDADSPVQGRLVAGCLEVLDWLRGTEWWPDLDGAVLVVETSEEQPSPDAVARMLRSIAATGDLQQLSALLVGRPGGADLDPARHADYDAAVLRVVRDECDLGGLPVICGVDVGHTDPMWTLPIGVTCDVDVETRTVGFPEPCVSTADPSVM